MVAGSPPRVVPEPTRGRCHAGAHRALSRGGASASAAPHGESGVRGRAPQLQRTPQGTRRPAPASTSRFPSRSGPKAPPVGYQGRPAGTAQGLAGGHRRGEGADPFLPRLEPTTEGCPVPTSKRWGPRRAIIGFASNRPSLSRQPPLLESCPSRRREASLGVAGPPRRSCSPRSPAA